MNHHPGDEPASRSRHLPSPPPQPTVGDRKSTRLNSSHLVISYAVFCLKKKKYVEIRTGEKQRKHGGCGQDSAGSRRGGSTTYAVGAGPERPSPRTRALMLTGARTHAVM